MQKHRFLAATLLLLFFPELSGAQELLQPPVRIAEPPAASVGSRFTQPPARPSQPVSLGDAPLTEGEVLDLETVLSLTTQNNPTLRQARLQISAELAKAQQAGLYPNPTLAYAGEQIFVDVEGDTDSPGEFQGGILSQRFITGGKLRLSREKYLRRAHVSEHLAVAQQYRVCNDVRIHFYRTLAAQQRLEMHRELLKTAEDAAVTARELYNAGQANRYDVRKSNVMLQRTRLDVQRAEHEYRMRFRELTALVGLDLPVGAVVGTLATTESLATFDATLARIVAESPEVLAARAKLAADRVTIEREEVEWIPDIVVSAGSGYNFDARETVAVADVSIEIPLFDRNQGTVAQARADYNRQRREIRRTELTLRQRLAMVYEEYAMAFEHATEYRDSIVPEMKAAYRELLGSYKENRIEWPDVLQAQSDYAEVRLAQINFEEQLRRSEVLIQGYLLDGGLNAASGPTPAGHIDSVPKPR
ncbi:TolC family protein [Aeoliella sp.]|uniref:TolC family protein n=1 Tax=Aeoliella sp. TaxID=2795800 RepID=UPI003CCBF711